jgi:hypothetical protein
MTPEYIIRKSMCRAPHCSENDKWGTIAEKAESALEDIRFAPAYAEKGYDQPTKDIIFADWNKFGKNVDRVLEAYGYAIEWNDEWSQCNGCDNAFRTSPDSYGWSPSYVLMNECELVCLECLDGQEDEYLEGLEDNGSTALNIRSIDPAKFGYQLIKDGFESGWHPGQNDDPQTILKALQALGKERLLFKIDDSGQFDMAFSVWEKVTENDETDEFLFQGNHIGGAR